jgi:hypothetical protein
MWDDTARPVSVIGMDDHELASVVDLTTVAQPVRELSGSITRPWLLTSGFRLPSRTR